MTVSAKDHSVGVGGDVHGGVHITHQEGASRLPDYEPPDPPDPDLSPWERALITQAIQGMGDIGKQRIFALAGYCAPNGPIPHDQLRRASAGDDDERMIYHKAGQVTWQDGRIEVKLELYRYADQQQVMGITCARFNAARLHWRDSGAAHHGRHD
jgi:hypothetical protein